MLSFINDQTQEIGYLHDNATRCNVSITSLEGQLEDLSEYHILLKKLPKK